jgi:hypothetical protein
MRVLLLYEGAAAVFVKYVSSLHAGADVRASCVLLLLYEASAAI